MFADQFQGISAAPVDRWKEELGALDARVIELMIKSTLVECDYSPSYPNLPQSLAARFGGRRPVAQHAGCPLAGRCLAHPKPTEERNQIIRRES